jgi:hypothetical protein
VPLHERCKTAGCNTREPQGAASDGPAPADRIVCAGRRAGRGDEWTDEPRSRGRGVRGGPRRMLHVAGREILPGPRRPLGTTASKAEPQSLLARQAGRGAQSTAGSALATGREGRSPAAGSGARRSVGGPLASRLPTEWTQSGHCREPEIAPPSRSSSKGFRASLTQSGERMSSGRLGDRSRRTRGPLGWMAWRASG